MNTSNDYLRQKERALTRKIKLINMMGGKCEKCGYDKNISALEFHHINPHGKKFQLDSRHLSNSSMDRIEEEASKCILVCSNCHREIHNPDFQNEKIGFLIEKRKGKNIKPKEKKHKCKHCGKDIEHYTSGKKFCSEECKISEMNSKYPSFEEIMEKYKEIKTWMGVAKYFRISEKRIRKIRKTNNKGL